MFRSLFLKNKTCLLVVLVAILLVSSFLSETVLSFECNQVECPEGYNYCACRGFNCQCAKRPQLTANMIEKKVPVTTRQCAGSVCEYGCYCNGYEYEYKCVCPGDKGYIKPWTDEEEELFDAIFDEEE